MVGRRLHFCCRQLLFMFFGVFLGVHGLRLHLFGGFSGSSKRSFVVAFLPSVQVAPRALASGTPEEVDCDQAEADSGNLAK